MKRVRFAPSPTGSLHIGNALSALANRALGDWMLLRIDDTDTARNIAGEEEAILRDLAWLGLACGEAPGSRRGAAAALRRGDAVARRRFADLPPRLRRRRRRLRDHARRAWE